MPYVVLKQPPKHYQISIDDILDGTVNLMRLAPVNNTSNTVTRYIKNLKEQFTNQYNINMMTEALINFNDKYQNLFEAERESLYDKFYIPKKSRGLREINAPKPELMKSLRELKDIFEINLGCLYHTSSFAYVKQRCAVDAVRRHKNNESRWFAKFDFSNFFGNTTQEYVLTMLKEIFPFSEIAKTEGGLNALNRALSLCFLNGGLPQGTPISPTITNIMMIPVDHYLCNNLREKGFVYTRYADDIIISSRYDFEIKKIEQYIVDSLVKFKAPFSLNTKKTRYGSSSGNNWNLGVMLNKDNEITIGHQKKKHFKAMITNYIQDKKHNKNWDLHDVQVMQGLISYYKSIEKNYIEYIISHHNKKFNANLEKMIKQDLHG